MKPHIIEITHNIINDIIKSNTSYINKNINREQLLDNNRERAEELEILETVGPILYGQSDLDALEQLNILKRVFYIIEKYTLEIETYI